MADPQTLLNKVEADITDGQNEVAAALAEGAAVRDQVAALESAIAQLHRIKKRIGTDVLRLQKRDERMRALAQHYGERVARATQDLAADGPLDSTDSDVKNAAENAVKAVLPAGTVIANLVTVVKNFDTETANLVTNAQNALVAKRDAAADADDDLDEAATNLDEVERHMTAVSDLALATHETALRELAVVKDADDPSKYTSVVHLRDFLDAYDRLKRPMRLADGDYQFDVDDIATANGAVNKLTEAWDTKHTAYRTALLAAFQAEIEVAEERIKVAAAEVKAATRKANRATLAAEAVREEVEGP